MSTGVQGQSSAQFPTKSSSNQAVPPLSPSPQALGQGRSLGMPKSPSPQEMGVQGLNTDPIVSSNSNSVPKPLLPSFTPRKLSQLPTPQSPNNFGQYVLGVPYTPESPVPHSSQSSYAAFAPMSVGQRLAVQRQLHAVEDARIISQPMSQQTITPESSPFLRSTSRYTNSATPQYYSNSHSSDTATPRAPTSPIKLESSTSTSALAPAHRISSPVSSSEHHSSRLSSPFMAKLSIADKSAKSRTPGHSRPESYTPELRPMREDDVFSSALVTRSGSSRHTQERPPTISTPPISPLLPPQSDGQIPGHTAGGEMERIRQAMIQDRLIHFQETESRRPDYLKRAKRTLSEADPTALVEDEAVREQERAAAVGITESPNKGRRLKLFQETSEESFEESLMAGGYGRYRTAEWVRQPQPLTLVTPGPAGPSNVVTTLEEAEEAPPTEKELKKRKRLAAFRGERTPYDEPSTKLYPVELEGRGRVLLDVPAEEPTTFVDPEPTPSKKKGGTRRKRKGAEPTAKEKKALAMAAAAAENLVHKPNWPDTEFPWKLRTEERADMAKAEEDEKMKWIERFLDRDSDDEDDNEGVSKRDIDQDMSPPSHWSLVYENEADQPPRGGRGKMVPLLANPSIVRPAQLRRKSSYFPSDPSDARAALLSKKSVRTLSYRQQRRLRQKEDDSDDEIVCVCRGRDDGRELVQCDGCETWYHLECIGIRNISELGKEEDPWFCRICEMDDAPSSLTQREANSEPTFVPTDEEPRRSLSFDPPFFQPSLQDSPMTWNPARMPKTPTRSGRDSDYDHGLSSSTPWIDSSRNDPSTPQRRSQGARIYTNHTPGQFDAYDDESPFDPTSTPSRGIKFGVPFATPKNNVWSARANGSFHTPSKAGSRTTGGKTFGGPGTLSNTLDDSGGENNSGLSSSPFSRMHPYDESPIRRAISGEGPRGRGVTDSPLTSRSKGSLQQLEDSPDMRYREREGYYQSGRRSFDQTL